MDYPHANSDDRIAALEAELHRRQKVLSVADAFYLELNPFHKDFPPCAEAILEVMEDNMDDLEDWAGEPARILRGIGH